jgi:hypothetical protein
MRDVDQINPSEMDGQSSSPVSIFSMFVEPTARGFGVGHRSVPHLCCNLLRFCICALLAGGLRYLICFQVFVYTRVSSLSVLPLPSAVDHFIYLYVYLFYSSTFPLNVTLHILLFTSYHRTTMRLSTRYAVLCINTYIVSYIATIGGDCSNLRSGIWSPSTF